MKKFEPNRPLWQYKLREYLLLFDSYSEEERILAYRYGWHIFSRNRSKQQDISINHFRSFLTELSGYKNVQTLLFASFENSDESFKIATDGLDFKFNYIDKKLIKPLMVR